MVAAPCVYSVASISIPNEGDITDLYAVFLSFLPWLVALAIATLLVVSRPFRHWPFFHAISLATALAFLLTEIIKQLVRQARPSRSCVTSFGMPSSHAAVSTVWLFFFLLKPIMKFSSLESVYTVDQFLLPTTATNTTTNTTTTNSPLDRAPPPSSFSSSSSSSEVAATNRFRTNLVKLFVIINLILIIWSRTHLGDHSLLQVVAGSTCGVIVSLLVFGWFHRKYGKFVVF